MEGLQAKTLGSSRRPAGLPTLPACHNIQELPIVTVAGVVVSHLGPICLIMHQYAYHGKGKTIHSCVQVEDYGNDVNDTSLKVKDGKQRITTLENYVIPLQIR